MNLIHLLPLVVNSFQVINVASHGNILYPYSWVDPEGTATNPNGDPDGEFDKVGHTIKPGCISGIPNEHCEENDRQTLWYTNYTHVPEEFACDRDTHECIMGTNYIDIDLNKQKKGHEWKGTFPWVAAGRAPVYGPCGCGGGNPDGGCTGKKLEEELFGDCCGGHHSGEQEGCGGYAFGFNLETLDFAEPIVSTWKRGESEMVVWYVTANHWGGYSYRLCKMPDEGRMYLTEECFQQTPLQFDGSKQWLKSKDFDDDGWREIEAKRITEGTFPPGSEWTKMPFIGPPRSDNPTEPVIGGQTAQDERDGWIKDYVKVPSDIAPGEYVLSFRWDAEKTPQIWQMCSTVIIE